ncbi:hypothetical protein GCM10023063_49650 [Arthrobacter methylotrophus]|uniref:efflux RND transporter permease subunit n=1 Tax=Arthrobacter methylotrophus TaxID=121291 RepID=UPI0031EF7ED6
METAIRDIIPKQELSTILDNLGVPNSGINLSYSNAGTIGTLDGEILIALHEGERKPSAEYIRRLREELPKRFPGVEFAFQPADIVSQILNFGLPSAIDVQFSGADVATNKQLAGMLANRIKQIPGAVDTHVHQRFDQPTLALNMDRTRIQQVGLEGRDVAQNLLVSLSSSFQTSPTFWLNPITVWCTR